MLKYIQKSSPIVMNYLQKSNILNLTGMSLCDILNEGFKQLCNDIIQNPSILVTNYLTEYIIVIAEIIYLNMKPHAAMIKCVMLRSRHLHRHLLCCELAIFINIILFLSPSETITWKLAWKPNICKIKNVFIHQMYSSKYLFSLYFFHFSCFLFFLFV